MSDRNELAKLFAKSKTVLIGKNLPESERARIEIRQLSTDEIEVLDVDKNASTQVQKEQTQKLIARSIDVPIEDVKKMAVAFMEELVDTIIRANDLADDDKIAEMKKSLNNKMADIQDQLNRFIIRYWQGFEGFECRSIN